MKSSSRYLRTILFLLVLAGCLTLGASSQAGASARDYSRSGNARLIIRRVADFGTILYLNVAIDGVRVTSLGVNERYEAIVRPGNHVFSVNTSPSPWGQNRFNNQRIHLKRGESASYTAMWEGADKVVLEKSSAYHARPVW